MGFIGRILWKFVSFAPYMAFFLLLVTAVGWTAPLWQRLAGFVAVKTGLFGSGSGSSDPTMGG